MKKYLNKNKAYTYKDATVYEVFEVKISGLTEIEEKMFSAFEFAEYSPFFGAEDMAQLPSAPTTDCPKFAVWLFRTQRQTFR